MAIAVGQTYRKLGVLMNGRVLQMAVSVDLVGAGPEETRKLVGEAARLAAGGIFMLNDTTPPAPCRQRVACAGANRI